MKKLSNQSNAILDFALKTFLEHSEVFNDLKRKVETLQNGKGDGVKSSEDLAQLTDEVMRSPFLFMNKMIKEKGIKTLPNNFLLLKHLLIPDHVVNTMQAFAFGPYLIDVCKKVMDDYIQMIEANEKAMTKMLRELCLVYLQTTFEVFLKDLTLEFFDYGLLKSNQKRSNIRKNFWSTNKRLLEEAGIIFHQLSKFNKLKSKRNKLLHQGSNIQISPALLEKSFSDIVELFHTLEAQALEKITNRHNSS